MLTPGTVILSVVPSKADASSIAAQRARLNKAIDGKDLQALKEALDGTAGVEELKTEVAAAQKLASELAGAQGNPVVGIRPVASEGNNLSKIEVHSVSKPYAILDDISYRIAKNRGEGTSWKRRELPRFADDDYYRGGLLPGGLRGMSNLSRFGRFIG